MNDDDFSGLVRSGSQHSVSVSEHTGNAKTPKNIVVSHEEETEARKRAFEQKALADLEAEKALSAALAEHTEYVAPNEVAPDANIQKVVATKEATHRQGIATEVAAKPNVQNVYSDVLAANNQQVSTDKIQDNIQTVGNGQGIAPNVQSVDNGNIAANKQMIAGEKAIEANRQGVSTDEFASNVQAISNKSLATNNQSVAQDASGQNRQGLDSGPATATNLQAIPQDDVLANRQSLGKTDSATNRQGIASNATAANEQHLPNLGGHDNLQPLDQGGFSSNLQAIPEGTGLAPNKQPIGSDAPSLNRQAAPQDAPVGLNRQGEDNGKIESHFEQLPSSEVVRKTVDFSSDASSDSHAGASINTAASSQAKPSSPYAKQRARLTTTELRQQAKLKREQMNDAFHGRLAGIKHNVDALNHRLTDFEEKVHKEDVKLDKGNPEDFDINLD